MIENLESVPMLMKYFGKPFRGAVAWGVFIFCLGKCLVFGRRSKETSGKGRTIWKVALRGWILEVF